MLATHTGSSSSVCYMHHHDKPCMVLMVLFSGDAPYSPSLAFFDVWPRLDWHGHCSRQGEAPWPYKFRKHRWQHIVLQQRQRTRSEEGGEGWRTMVEEETRMNACCLFYSADRLDSDVPHQKLFIIYRYIYIFFTKQMKERSFILHAKGQNGGIRLGADQQSAFSISTSIPKSRQFPVCKESLCLYVAREL